MVVKEILVETDFLFGLNAKNKLYPSVLNILEKYKKGEIRIVISSASSIEAYLTLIARNIDTEVIANVLRLMNMKIYKDDFQYYTPFIELVF